MDTINFTNMAGNMDTVDAISDGSIRDILRSVPGSYDDFVNSTAECMSQDADLRKKILNLLRVRPESDSSDILKELCNFYGFNKPLELVDDDDDDDEFYSGANAGGLRKVAY